MSSPRSTLARDSSSLGQAAGFLIATVALVWLTHAIAFFAHEYAHSFTAWALGWKANPWIINFGHADAANFFMMIEMDEKVDYAPIFAADHGFHVAAIAAAGVVVGNGLLFVICQALFTSAVKAGQRWLSIFLYWLCVVCVGNFIAYVPMRTFTTIYDMGHVQQGLGVSPWMLILVLGIPFAIGIWFVLSRMLPRLVANVLAGTFEKTVAVILTPFVIFFFYGSAGWEPAFDITAKVLAVISMGLIFPLTSAILWIRLVRPGMVASPI